MKNSIIYALVFVGLQAAAGLIIGGAWALMGEDVHELTTTKMVATMTLFSALTLAVFLLAKWAEVSPRWLLTQQWTVLIWAVIAAMGMVIPETWLLEQIPELPNWIEDEQEMLMNNYWGYLAIGLLAPLAEEIVFRGAILRTLLTQMKPWTAIAVSALLFSLVHMNPSQMPFAFLVGILLGWMYWRTGSILPSMAYHWANNSIAYIVYRTYPDPDIKLVDIFKGSETHVYMAVLFSLLIFIPAIYQLHLRMKRAEG